MLKSVRDLFFPGGQSSGGSDRTGDDDLRRLWASLIRVGAARGLMLPDAEDLAQESIEAGMTGFDPARGDFGAFYRAIMANRTTSFHRVNLTEHSMEKLRVRRPSQDAVSAVLE